MMFSDDDDLYYYTRRDYMYDTDDSGPYYDDDDYYDDYDYYDSDSEARYARRVAEYKIKSEKEKLSKEEDSKNAADNTPKVFQCSSLVNVCARHLAINFPFAYLQDRFPPIPDDLQLKVIMFSFPDSEEKIRKYAEFSRSGADINYPSKLCNAGKVKDMMQIGFRLSATVEDKYVTIHFDRGKITSAQCTCESSSSWCLHVIATALMRIRNADSLDKSKIRLPVSDALNVLSREQLLKFSQYLLYHHQNQKIVETAQGLIDKLANRHGDYSEEEINVVDGAPDPTAGPGLDEDCHWFVCTTGFKENCSNLIYEPADSLGFAPLENRDDSCLLHELWYRNRCHYPLVQDDIDTEVGAEFYCPYSLERRQDSSKILETVLELLKDDSMSGLIAIKSCTEQVLSRLEKKGSPYESRRSRRSSSSQDVNKPLYPCGSPAMGFTARPFRCWTLCDELSVLWQLAVLNPRMNVKEKQEVSLQLMKWSEEAATGCFIEKLKPWKGLEVAYNLCQYIDWRQPHMQAILKDKIPSNYAINGLTLVHVNTDTIKKRPSISCHLPYSFYYGSTTLDIHTWCSIINALQVHNYNKPAVHIAFGLALGFINLYRNNIETRTRFSNIAVLINCTLEHNSKHSESKSNAKEDGPEGMDIDDEKPRVSCPEIWPPDALLSLRCFAFLCEFLSKNNDEVESLIASHKGVDFSGDDELAATLSKVSGSNSLRFQTAAIGLFLPRFPMAVMKQETEQYDLENWLSSQLLESKPTPDDMAFLNHLCTVALKDGSQWPLAPPSSFTRVTLHHSFKDSNSAAVAISNPLQNKALILELAFKTLDFTQVVDSHGWTLFEFSTAVSWSKLAELSLSCLAGFTTQTERAMTSILKQTGVFGPGKHKHLVKASPEEIRSSRQCIRTTMDGKSKICFALAKALITRLRRSSNKKSPNLASRIVPLREVFSSTRNRILDVFPKIESPLAIMALKKCAIRLGAHSVYLEKTSNRSYSHGSAIRWLIDCSIECGLWGLRCLINSHPDINDFMQHEEAINLCKNILKKKDDSMLSIVKEILLSLLRQAVRTEATDNIRDILVTCRENHREISYLLTPWVCQHIHDMAMYNTVHFETLMSASEQVFKCYNYKLNQTTNENQRMKAWEGGLGLKRLFNEGRDDSDSEEPASKPHNVLNPYLTSKKPHPYLELSFELGLMGLNALTRGNESPLRRYRRSDRDKKERVQEFCEVVCYISTKKWLDLENKQGECSSKRFSASYSTGSSRVTDESYITRFVTELLKSVTNPMHLLSFLREISSKLFPDLDEDVRKLFKGDRSNAASEHKQGQLRKAINTYPSLLLMIQRIESQFRELLLGPKVTLLIKNITDRRPHSSHKELRPEFEYHDLEEDTLRDTLKAAKEVSEVLDSSGDTFKKLVSDIQSKHEELQPVLEGILSGEEIPRHREGELFRNPFFFWPFIQELQFGRRHPLEDFF